MCFGPKALPGSIASLRPIEMVCPQNVIAIFTAGPYGLKKRAFKFEYKEGKIRQRKYMTKGRWKLDSGQLLSEAEKPRKMKREGLLENPGFISSWQVKNTEMGGKIIRRSICSDGLCLDGCCGSLEEGQGLH